MRIYDVEVLTIIPINIPEYLAQPEEILENLTISFTIDGISRLESMVLCEMKGSYVQQSQRYVRVTGGNWYCTDERLGGDDKEQYANIMRETMDEYLKLTEPLPDQKGRNKQTVSGKPLETLRGILPLATKTKMACVLNGEVLCRIGKKIKNSKEYRRILYPIIECLFMMCKDISPKICKGALDYFNNQYGSSYCDLGTSCFFPRQELHIYPLSETNSGVYRIANAGIISTNSPALEEYYSQRSFVKRVLGYGHTSIAEQAVYSFECCCSLAAYHQLIRHRMLNFYRERLLDTISGANQEDSKKRFMAHLAYNYDVKAAALLLTNDDKVCFVVSGNARAFIEMCQKRLCNNAQAEIRLLAEEIAKYLKIKGGGAFDDLLTPPCCRGACPEGKLTCGKAAEVRAKYNCKGMVK